MIFIYKPVSQIDVREWLICIVQLDTLQLHTVCLDTFHLRIVQLDTLLLDTTYKTSEIFGNLLLTFITKYLIIIYLCTYQTHSAHNDRARCDRARYYFAHNDYAHYNCAQFFFAHMQRYRIVRL